MDQKLTSLLCPSREAAYAAAIERTAHGAPGLLPVRGGG
jgi:hypothetical protein